MPQYSIKLCTYDPVIIDAFDRLRKNRKQAAFTHEALKQFLSTEKGGQVLQLMEGKATTEPSLRYISLSSDSPCIATPSERVRGNNKNMLSANTYPRVRTIKHLLQDLCP